MLNTTDQATFLSLRELRRSIQEAQKPLVFWIGAGASKWLNYPLWKELARQLRREFSRFVDGFDNEQAHKLIETNFFPRFFQQCRDLDQARYYRFLSNAFLPLPETALRAIYRGSRKNNAAAVPDSQHRRGSGATIFWRRSLSAVGY